CAYAISGLVDRYRTPAEPSVTSWPAAELPSTAAAIRTDAAAMRRVPWSLAGRLLARDWKSGEVIVLFIALVVAVAAIGAVTFFTDRVRQTMAQQAGETLAADLRLESTLPLPDELFREAAARNLLTAGIIHFRSVVLSGDASSLADVRGATDGYPLRGEVRIADSLGGPAPPATGVP